MCEGGGMVGDPGGVGVLGMRRVEIWVKQEGFRKLFANQYFVQGKHSALGRREHCEKR